MLKRLLDYIIGRREPSPDLSEDERRVKALEVRVRVLTGGKR